MRLVQTYRVLRKDGSTCWVEDHKTSRLDEHGSFLGVDGVVLDVTERIGAQRELRKEVQRKAAAEAKAQAEKKTADELRAANQQLRASEQQLKASDQQLRAQEQALRASREELRSKVSELERFNKLMVGREMQMIELKVEVNALLKELERPAKYQVSDKRGTSD